MIYLIWAELQIGDWEFDGSWLQPHPWLVQLDEWYDQRYPAPPRTIKIHRELLRVRATVRILLLLTGIATGFVLANSIIWTSIRSRLISVGWLAWSRGNGSRILLVGFAVAIYVVISIGLGDDPIWEFFLFHPSLFWGFIASIVGIGIGQFIAYLIYWIAMFLSRTHEFK